MRNSSQDYFKKSLKNYKIFLNRILILNLISFVLYSIFPFITSFLYSNINSLGIDRDSIWLMVFIFEEFTPFVIPILSLLLHFFISTIMTNKIQDYKLKEIFKSIKSLTNLSFILLFVYYYSHHFYYFSTWIIIIALVVFLNSYRKLRKKDIDDLLNKYIVSGLILYLIGGILSYLFVLFNADFGNLGPGFVIIGIRLINMKVFPYFSLKNKENLTLFEKIQQKLPQNKLYGQISESQIKPVQEINVVKAEYEPELDKISKNSIQEEFVEQTYESYNQPEIIFKEDSPQIDQKTTILKTAAETEIKILPKKTNTKKLGFTNIRKSLKLLSKKPIQNKRILKDDIFKVSKKKCPFCGKEHDDLNVPFCHACGHKF